MERKQLFLVCVLILVLPSLCKKKKHNATIYDYHNDKEMIDQQCTGANHTNYCFGKIGNCERGTHVMCMIYKTDMVMGPHCENGAMLKMQQEFKNLIINQIELLRVEVTDELARGLNDVLLPRAYDLQARLIWNAELALFAQVWTNQCRREQDKCRDTKKFFDVEQFVGVDFYTRDDWESIKNKDEKLNKMKANCLTRAKITDAIKQIIKLLTEPKETTTKDLINSFDGKRNTYLMLLYHKTTEIGCGLSYYLNYQWLEEKNQKRDVFVLQLVCNLSSRPVQGKPIYYTSPQPKTTAPTELPTTPSDEASSQSSGAGPADGGPGIVIMPIITVEDAPLAITQQRSEYKSKLRESPKSIAPSSRKNSIFSRAPIFNLPSRNRDNSSIGNIEDKITLKKKLKTLMEQVPRRDIPRLRELLKNIVTKHKSEEKQISRMGPVERLDTVGSEVQEYVRGKSNNVSPNIVNDDELSQLTKGKFKEINHGLTSFISDVENYPDNTGINIQDTAIEFYAQTPFNVPNIRKLKPIVHVSKENKPKKFQHEKRLDRYNAMLDNNQLVSKTAIIDQIDDKTNMGTNIEGQPVRYAEGNNINSHKSNTLDDMKSKRRVYFENEVSKLKRKLQHLRHFIHENDVNEHARIRPMVTSHIGQRNSKVDERRNFYMPDRAHPLHEY